jgi:predicted acetyltransferase
MASFPGTGGAANATEILRQSLVIARANGIDRVLVTCNEDNAGSIAVIEACGGQLHPVIQTAPQGPRKRRYWID